MNHDDDVDEERPCEHCGKKPTTMLSPKEAGVELSAGMPIMWRKPYPAGSCRYFATIAPHHDPAHNDDFGAVSVCTYIATGDPRCPRVIRRVEVARRDHLRLPSMAETARIEEYEALAKRTEAEPDIAATRTTADGPTTDGSEVSP